MFLPNREEWGNLKSQNVTSSWGERRSTIIEATQGEGK